jgi:WD40 repeat protein
VYGEDLVLASGSGDILYYYYKSGLKYEEGEEYTGKKLESIIQTHAGNECLSLALSLVRSEIFVLTSEDIIYKWDYVTKELINAVKLSYPSSRIVVSENNDYLAVGCTNGVLVVLDPKTLREKCVIVENNSEISAIAFSKSSDLLAVGTASGELLFLSAPMKFKPSVDVVSTHNTRVMSFDFSMDSCIVKVVYEPYHVQIFDVSKGTQIDTYTNQINMEQWSTWSTPVGWEVQGIQSYYREKSDLKLVKTSSDKELVIVADKFGMVKLFDFPAYHPKTPFEKIMFNSGEIASICFTDDKKRCFILGKKDKCLIQLHLINENNEDRIKIQDY